MTDDTSLVLYDSWMKEDPILTENVMSQDKCDIEPNFMCFADIYYHLSKIIPLELTVVDLGCAFAPQCFYFKNHKKYIGVDLGHYKRFRTNNSEIYEGSIKEFIFDEKFILNPSQTFAIMSFVPAQEDTYYWVKRSFINLFVYYPSCTERKFLLST